VHNRNAKEMHIGKESRVKEYDRLTTATNGCNEKSFTTSTKCSGIGIWPSTAAVVSPSTAQRIMLNFTPPDAHTILLIRLH
jgi:hypothetical protein